MPITLPSNVEAERVVLGSMLLDEMAAELAIASLREEDFSRVDPRNVEVFKAAKTLWEQNKPIDPQTVMNALINLKTEKIAGGNAYIYELINAVINPDNIEYYISMVQEQSVLRQLLLKTDEIQKNYAKGVSNVAEFIVKSNDEIASIASKRAVKGMRRVSDVTAEVKRNMEIIRKSDRGLLGVTTGYTSLDNMTLGWQKGDMIILAARPSVGKTAFVLTMARNMVVDHKVPVAFFSLEMPDTQLVTRIMISETGLPSEKLRGAKKMTQDEWAQLESGLNNLSRAPLWIDDTPSLSIYEFRSKARRLVNKQHVKLIIIDYLQLMTGPPELRGMREQEVSAISRSLKAIAKELSIPIIALSQLSRAVETRGGNKRPQLSDLRESGAIEQDADIVMFIHRPEYSGTETADQYPGYTQLIIAKHRNGETRDVEMRFIKDEARFVDANSMYSGDSPAVYDSVESKLNNTSANLDFDNETY